MEDIIFLLVCAHFKVARDFRVDSSTFVPRNIVESSKVVRDMGGCTMDALRLHDGLRRARGGGGPGQGHLREGCPHAAKLLGGPGITHIHC